MLTYCNSHLIISQLKSKIRGVIHFPLVGLCELNKSFKVSVKFELVISIFASEKGRLSAPPRKNVWSTLCQN